MDRVRVVLADDSSVARQLLRSFLESDGGIEIVGEARNGREAVNLVRALKPNLVTMDLEMPVMNGLQAIEEIMAAKAVPILVVSSVADAENAYEAVARGALEVIGKPECDAMAVGEFIAKVKLLAKVPVITHIRRRTTGVKEVFPAASTAPARIGGDDGAARVFAIAASTGGPQALAAILSRLPAGFPCPILVAQHISDGFAAGFAKWLSGTCKIPARLAQEGESIMPGVIYVSPSEHHMAVTPSRRITLVERRAGEVFRPSCNALLNAVAEVYCRRSVGIILTGMSSDGVQGIERIHKAGGVTLAQDEASSAIFGMNKVAIDSGCVQQVLSLDAIAQCMLELAGLPVSTGVRFP